MKAWLTTSNTGSLRQESEAGFQTRVEQEYHNKWGIKIKALDKLGNAIVKDTTYFNDLLGLLLQERQTVVLFIPKQTSHKSKESAIERHIHKQNFIQYRK